jgi:hypothetical protein
VRVSNCDEAAGSSVFVDKFYDFRCSSHSVWWDIPDLSYAQNEFIAETSLLGSASSVIPIGLHYETPDPIEGRLKLCKSSIPNLVFPCIVIAAQIA